MTEEVEVRKVNTSANISLKPEVKVHLTMTEPLDGVDD